MFVIQHNSGLYYHNKGRIILFESPQEAQNFMQMFVQYATERITAESQGDIGAIMRVPIVVMHECGIVPVDFDIETVECGTVWARELFENRGN